MKIEFEELFKYFDWQIMNAVLSQSVMETLNRGIEELNVKITKADIERHKAQLVLFAINNTELPLLLKPFRWFLKGYLERRAFQFIDELESLIKKTRVRKTTKKSVK